MTKLVAILTNHPSAQQKPFFEGTKIIEFEVRDSQEILETLESKIMKLRGNNETAIGLQVKTESGVTVLRGIIKDGFSGTSIS